MDVKTLMRMAGCIASDVATGNALAEYVGFGELPCVLAQPFAMPLVPVPLVINIGILSIEDDGTVWATTGAHLYRADPVTHTLRRHSSLPCPGILGTLIRFPRLRRYLRFADLTISLSLHSGAHLLRNLRWLYRRGDGDTRYHPVHRLERFGSGYGRGLLHRALVQLTSGRILYGDYFDNPQRLAVRIVGSDDDGLTWHPVFVFPPGQIRHIHAVVEDPFSGDVFVCAGDSDQDSRVVRSTDGGQTMDVVGSGSQAWRTCNLLFTDNAIVWGGDSARFPPAIYRYDRRTSALEQLQLVDGAIEDGVQLCNGLMVFGTCRGGYSTEWDANLSLWIGNPEQGWVRCPLQLTRGSFRGYAALRFVTSPNREYLGVVFKNVKPYGYASVWISAASLAAFCHQESSNARTA